MTGIEIIRTVTFSVVSYGNGTGTGYAFYRRPLIDTPLDDCPSVWLQDDDAHGFREDLAMVERTHADWSRDKQLAWLWDQHGYGDVAEVA